MGVGELEDIEGAEESLAEGRDEAVVWRGIEGEEVDTGGARGAGKGASAFGGG